MTRTARLLSAIPDAPTLWPLWFWPHCEVCDEGCEDARDESHQPVLICLDCSRDVPAPVWQFDPVTDGESLMTMWGGDLADPRNMHLLWMVAEWLAIDLRLESEFIEAHTYRYTAVLDAEVCIESTASEALFRACEAALGLDAWMEGVEK